MATACRSGKMKRGFTLWQCFTADAKNTSDEGNIKSTQLTPEIQRGALQTRCRQKVRIGESLECVQAKP